ncbi:hypothetical protein BJ875DRAFT_233239 [Amylocarpus encephaloides]|uniref:Zn(2)-C6 fungal-type domain-containing protein n=1 Tax=Amylocarpus encephaloides TaxID=45428 RepID=A0A9P8BZT1_9HELO|nr:hypothetical protein BJ875DRAFT_233239 [Amylocarpus encephaloides]
MTMKATIGSRKPHQKTRTGCRTCKARKIKCDEQRPECSNCIKHSVPCDYLASTTSTGSTGSSYQPNTPADSVRTSRDTSSPIRSLLPNQRPAHLYMGDLELLHNFCTSTCLTLHRDSTLKTLWKINVPQVGFTWEFVMRGILALSALHMAHYVPGKRDFYKSQAMIQHQSGLRVAVSMLPHLTNENVEALYIFSTMTLFIGLASFQDTSQLWLVGDQTTLGSSWLELLKGTYSLIGSSWDILSNGPFGPMFRAGGRRSELREEAANNFPIEQDPTQEIRHQLDISGLEDETYDLCTQATNELRKSFALLIHDPNPEYQEFGDAFIWLFRVNNGYLDLLRKGCQSAIAIFGYFCVLLKSVDHKWWMEGCSSRFLSQIYNMLDEEHRLWIRWPIEEIGWVPPVRSTTYSHPGTPHIHAPEARMEIDSAPGSDYMLSHESGA